MNTASLSQTLATFWHPDEVRTNRCTELIRVIACLTMLCDHCGKMFFPQVPQMRLIGRLAFPLFAYSIAAGSVFTRDPWRYLSRVVLLALVSQPLYALGLAHENAGMYAVSFAANPLYAMWTFYIQSWQKPSILLSLSLGLSILLCIRHRRFILALGLYLLCERFASALDYGVEGIRLMLVFYAFLQHPFLFAPAAIGYWLMWSLQGRGYPFFGIQFGMRIYALPAIVLVCIPMQHRRSLPKWLTYGFYPGHLAILAVLTHWPK